MFTTGRDIWAAAARETGIVGVHQHLCEIESRKYPLVRRSPFVQYAAQMRSIYSELPAPRGYAAGFVDLHPQCSNKFLEGDDIDLGYRVTWRSSANQDPFQPECPAEP